MLTNAKVKNPENVKAVKMQFERNDSLALFWWNGDILLLPVRRCFNAALWNWKKKKDEKLVHNWL